MADSLGFDVSFLRFPANFSDISPLSGKKIALYFSAHWCPPCRGFTPVLSKWYAEFKKHHSEKPFELIFLSSDRDEKSFNEYADSMTFPALKFEYRELKEKLSRKFGINGIPSLIFLDENGEIITKNGREKILKDKDILHSKFPFLPPSFSESISGKIINNKNEEFDAIEILRGKKYAIFYFSASWCGPCQKFTPILIEKYQKNLENLAIIFVSGDNDEDEFSSYFSKMPFFAIPFDDERIENLGTYFEIEGFPTCVIIDCADFSIVNHDGCFSIENNEDFPWKEKIAVKFNAEQLENLYEKPMLFVIDWEKSSEEILAKISPQIEQYEKEISKEIFIMTIGKDNENDSIAENITKSLLNQPKNIIENNMILVDINEKKRWKLNGNYSTDLIEKILNFVRNDTIEEKPEMLT